jgi:hypothetical protein
MVPTLRCTLERELMSYAIVRAAEECSRERVSERSEEAAAQQRSGGTIARVRHTAGPCIGLASSLAEVHVAVERSPRADRVERGAEAALSQRRRRAA